MVSNNQIIQYIKRHLVIITLFMSIVAGCSYNPATGERHFNLISESQEIEMGKEYDKQIVASMGLVQDQNLQNYVNSLGQSLAKSSERPNLPWSFKVVDDPAVNAFAVPGGFIYITRGILTHLNNEAELVGVLGHEIGHVTAKHTVYRMSEQQLTQLGLGVAMILKPELQDYGQIASTGLGLLFLKFGRDDERESDELGVRYMNKRGDDPTQMANVMRTLQRVSAGSGAGSIPQWLSTHPDPGNRIELINKHIAAIQGPKGTNVGRDQYIAKLDGVVFGENPREGFFEGNTFYHPELKFSFTFPQGWQTVNQKEGVVGISKNQDAMIQITLAEGNAANAAGKFFGQQGLQSSGVTTTKINGFNASQGNFSAQTEQGALSGTAAFIDYEGRVYQILAYTAAQQAGNYSGNFTGSIGSFNKVSDPRILNVQPNKVKIITLNENMTIEQFYQKYPSAVPIEQIALINGVEKGATLKKGDKAKQVVKQ